MTIPKIKADEFTCLAAYVYDISGIVLDDSKGYLIESRLGPLVVELDCRDYLVLCELARTDARVRGRIVDAISTNETSFFRDAAPFELFKHKIVPDHIDRQNGPSPTLNIWSAASSTGQEVYSIAITLKELLVDLSPWRIRIVGTDISEAAVAQASAGRYNQIEIQRGLTDDKRHQYFEIQGNVWCIQDELRAMARFQQFNLLSEFPPLGKFDIIFCRNVAIYFDIETRMALFDRIANQLNRNGVLLIGSTESLLGISDRFSRQEYHNSVYYSLREDQ
ncbi:MAG: protein-glutamate O-methyltransferase CheR [Candidatus Latescibacteria bacterium]|nr:protein-glutamate O-methyltransferase CheR [Candidatus Latescibacterota bacterium]MBT4138520.1 protein-glutamate O-methyltransferase CheR [Candidatus Latescibacterota bacterium]